MSSFNANDPSLIQNEERVSSTGRTYLQNLAYISSDAADLPDTFFLQFTDLQGNVLHSVYEALVDEVNNRSTTGKKLNIKNVASMDAFFNQFNAVSGDKMPNTWQGFITAFRNFYGIKNLSPTSPDSSFTEFVDLFSRMSGLPTDLVGTDFDFPADGELDIGSGVIGLEDLSGSASPSNQFIAAFNEFLRTFPYASDGTIKNVFASGSSTVNFFYILNQFLLPITTTTDASEILAYDSFTGDFTVAGDPTPPDQWIAQYDLFYNYFVEDASDKNSPAYQRFTEEFKDYYQKTVAKYGYFHPGHALDGWVSRMWNKFQDDKLPTTYTIKDDQDNILVKTNVVTSVSSIHSKRVLVLDRIFRLLAAMIGSLQEVAAAQAQQITFLSNWQRVFTDMITQIETFTRGDPSIFGKVGANPQDETEQTSNRSDANTAQVTRRETLSAWRGIVQDTAKREQTRVNQSQDAVSQQANIASAIIQQLITILGTIYR